MRSVTTVLAFTAALLVISSFDTARSDPYRWCAVFGSQHGGAQSCYSVTLEQCMATISGMGGFCTPNSYYDGQPVRTSEDGQPASRKRARPTR